jgi:hypothetical protein
MFAGHRNGKKAGGHISTHILAALDRSFRVAWPQQIEAELTKAAMVRFDRIFRRRKMEARIVMMIHDALWVEPPEREAEQVRHLMRKMMTTAQNSRFLWMWTSNDDQ